MSTTVDFDNLIDPDQIAVEIAESWREWEMLRSSWTQRTKELRNYVFATDTRTTGNAVLPWSNTTTTPKLTQIHDNLHANYTSTIFPQNRFVKWSPHTMDDAVLSKVQAIESYMANVVDNSGFRVTVGHLLSDWILTGNCFGYVDWQEDIIYKDDFSSAVGYKGPVLRRISPYDINFNPTAPSFKESPKIVRSIKTMGELERLVQAAEGNDSAKAAYEKLLKTRAHVATTDVGYEKSEGYIADGFSSIQQYYESDYVEILTFYGDYYDKLAGVLHKDQIIQIVDRAWVIDQQDNPSWLGRSAVSHVSWRARPDNLWGMGPLDNLVGMQYRIDHLENLKADVFDQIAYPILKIQGDVEDFNFQPGERIYMGDEGNVDYLRPDTTALNADFQIQGLEQKMEEMAGAPKQAMGIRTPGEKTAFEVQSLQNSASRIFEHKAGHFEREFLEPVLDDMLELGRRKLDGIVEVENETSDNTGSLFELIDASDLTGQGRLKAIGARHFAERARRVQQVSTLLQLQSNPAIAPHLSGKEMARMLAEELGERNLFAANIAIEEQLETAKVQRSAQIQDNVDQQEQMAAEDAEFQNLEAEIQSIENDPASFEEEVG
jgi:hypothetical protein